MCDVLFRWCVSLRQPQEKKTINEDADQHPGCTDHRSALLKTYMFKVTSPLISLRPKFSKFTCIGKTRATVFCYDSCQHALSMGIVPTLIYKAYQLCARSIMTTRVTNHLIRISMKLITALMFLIDIAIISTQASTNLDADAGYSLGGPLAVNNVHKRSCAVRQYGCEDGYCWSKCDDSGTWCWLALSRGEGDWVTCLNDSDCGPDPFRDAGCGNACGC
jgi:hypothetical protein